MNQKKNRKRKEEKNYLNDLKTVIFRLFRAEKLMREWYKRGGKPKLEIFTYLNLKGDKELNLPEHPYEKWNEAEKKVFRQCFGKPLVVPKNFGQNGTLNDFINKTLKRRRDLLREVCGMTPQSRFRGFKEFKSSKRKGK